VIEIRRGITRTVILIDCYAIKIPSLRAHGNGLAGILWSFARGISANLSEREWSGQPGLCPVSASLAGLVNVYPRCEPIMRELADEEYDAIGFIGPTDRKPQNVGLLGGRPVWIDYDNSWNDRPPCAHLGEAS
jgi:hypothetical protein